MFKYLKYYLSTFLIVLAIYVSSLGPNYPTFFFIGFSLFVVLGDLILPKDIITQKYSLPKLINLPIYINFPLLLIFLVQISFVMGSNDPAMLYMLLKFIERINFKSVLFLKVERPLVKCLVKTIEFHGYLLIKRSEWHLAFFPRKPVD